MFTGHSRSMEILLEELYEMRSAAEHLNPLKEKLTNYPDAERQNLVSLRTYQAELIARFIYQKILMQSEIRDIYKDDKTISDFWSQDTKALIKFWQKPIDLETPVQRYFHDFLP